MIRRAIAIGFLGLLSTAPAFAQTYGMPGPPIHSKVEIGAHGGYTWSDGQDVYLPTGGIGTLDLKSGGMWGITLDANLRSGTQLELLYNRQDSKLILDNHGVGSNPELVDTAVEYWHAGAIYGRSRGKVMPFTSFTLGATHIAYKNLNADDDWKFSTIFGLGLKAYLNPKLGLRMQGRFPFTFTSGYAGVACGGGGCSPSVSGSGIWQADVSAGAFLMLGAPQAH